MQLHLAFVQFKLTVSCLPKKVQQCLIMLYTCLPYSVSFPEDQNVICYYGDIRLLGTPQELMMNQKAFFTTHIYHLLSGNYLDQRAWSAQTRLLHWRYWMTVIALISCRCTSSTVDLLKWLLFTGCLIRRSKHRHIFRLAGVPNSCQATNPVSPPSLLSLKFSISPLEEVTLAPMFSFFGMG